MLAVVGGLSLRQARGPAEWPYAAIPLLFAVQQFIEGWLWLALPAQMPSAHGLTVLYLLFSNILWPIYVPVAVLLIEPSARHRTWLRLPLVAGTLVSGFFLYALLTQEVLAQIIGSHVKYHLPHKYEALAVIVYAAAACLAPLMSSHALVRLFGMVLVGSMIVAGVFYFMWFASVWCFFAAALSIVVLLHVRRRRALSQPG